MFRSVTTLSVLPFIAIPFGKQSLIDLSPINTVAISHKFDGFKLQTSLHFPTIITYFITSYIPSNTAPHPVTAASVVRLYIGDLKANLLGILLLIISSHRLQSPNFHLSEFQHSFHSCFLIATVLT
ncbi:MAG: hypothetical protein EZS28_022532 [Streblomastix strix]|uniref:Uncharacterized protein n=1 Tax=Streblomastix strix TaxID=222440 RepID=A0A5J4VH93_9EUKA|nr:MAG: hypothetical protein EZS28_022532 [Streblomastix strix]